MASLKPLLKQSPKQSLKQKIGFYIEKQACLYLQKQGLVLIQKNYQVRSGEIDLIMQDKAILVFIEVRYRRTPQFGGALESIDQKKQQRMIHAAQAYLLSSGLTDCFFCRFDVVIVSGNLLFPEIHWIQQAFDS